MERIYSATTGTAYQKMDLVRSWHILGMLAYTYGVGSDFCRLSHFLYIASRCADQKKYDDRHHCARGIWSIWFSGTQFRNGSLIRVALLVFLALRRPPLPPTFWNKPLGDAIPRWMPPPKARPPQSSGRFPARTRGRGPQPRNFRRERDFSVKQMKVIMAASGESLLEGDRYAVATN